MPFNMYHLLMVSGLLFFASQKTVFFLLKATVSIELGLTKIVRFIFNKKTTLRQSWKATPTSENQLFRLSRGGNYI